ncbi:LIM domain-containing protein E [Choanephora cucurbitarum]|uniref:LIM domain-containing protein E n=1 Tax=Choanephora cucurbitarum TaxID=101091 RepID=A0A1C7N1K7_9FUNG|nr:LIM domain-containing protein E [Choanephora cucurbitarum]
MIMLSLIAKPKPKTIYTPYNMESNKCHICSKTVYYSEKIEANNRAYHKLCFKCQDQGCRLTLANFHYHHGNLFCPKHVPKLKAIL